MDRMTPEQIQQAADLYAERWSLARVGSAVGADAETVRKRLREVGVATRATVTDARDDKQLCALRRGTASTLMWQWPLLEVTATGAATPGLCP